MRKGRLASRFPAQPEECHTESLQGVTRDRPPDAEPRVLGLHRRSRRVRKSSAPASGSRQVVRRACQARSAIFSPTPMLGRRKRGLDFARQSGPEPRLPDPRKTLPAPHLSSRWRASSPDKPAAPGKARRGVCSRAQRPQKQSIRTKRWRRRRGAGSDSGLNEGHSQSLIRTV